MNALSSSPNVPSRLFDSHKSSLILLALAFMAMYIPVYYELSKGAWGTDTNGHGPIILGLVFWLLWKDKEKILQASTGPSVGWGLLSIFVGVLFYFLGHSQTIDTLAASSQIPVLIGCLLLTGGRGSLKKAWFALFFLCFMIPLPGVLTQMITLPLKSAVSYCSEALLYWLGYPVGRTGVILVIGPYQLLVADACSGLNSIFTLEALGLFYMKLMNYTSRARNIFLAIMIIPISFVSNVTRVICLILITYYFGDKAGQGFMHDFAGMLLFGVALGLILCLDYLLAIFWDKPKPKAAT